MLTPITKKSPAPVAKPDISREKKDKDYIKTTTSQDGDMKKIFMAAGETLLTALIGRTAAARYLKGLTQENIQKEKVARIVGQIITPELLRQRLRNQAKLHTQLKEEHTSHEEMSKEEEEALKAAQMQEMEGKGEE